MAKRAVRRSKSKKAIPRNEQLVKIDDKGLLKSIYPDVQSIFKKNGLNLNDEYAFSDGSQQSYLPYIAMERDGDIVKKVGITYYAEGFEVLGEVVADIKRSGAIDIHVEFPEWSINEKKEIFENGGMIKEVVYHGSENRFETFDINKIGSSSNNTVGGWVFYFSNKYSVAKEYVLKGGSVITAQIEGEYFDLDNPLSQEDINNILKLASKDDRFDETDIEQLKTDYFAMGDDGYEVADGRQFLEYMTALFREHKIVSSFIAKMGYSGNIFRDRWDNTAINYVVFDSGNIKIMNIEKYKEGGNILPISQKNENTEPINDPNGNILPIFKSGGTIKRFYANCVNYPKLSDLDEIVDNEKEISRETFVSHVNKNDWNTLLRQLGYTKDFPIDKDWHVRYFKSKDENGDTVYFLRHSAIEYIFKDNADGIEEDFYPFADGGQLSTLLAPNGKPSNLTPEQYRLVRTPEFKAWFGDWENDPENASKIIDDNGEPMPCYHGTNSKDFYEFDDREIGRTDSGFYGRGFYFVFYSWSPKSARGEASYYGKNIIEAFINAKKPFDISSLSEYKGERVSFIGAESAVFFMNVSKMFPEHDFYGAFKKTYGEKEYDGGVQIIKTQVSGKEFVKLFEKYSNELKWIDQGERILAKYEDKVLDSIELIETNRKNGFYGDDLNRAKAILITKAIDKLHSIEVTYMPEGIMTRNPQITKLLRMGHDAILQSKVGDELVVFDPSQIKLADGSNTTFQPDNKDIRYESGGSVEELIMTDKDGNKIPVPSQQTIIDILKEHPLIKLNKKVLDMWIVGSFAKGTATKRSDIDILIQVPPDKNKTEEELTVDARKKIIEYFMKNKIMDIRDDLHPNYMDRRIYIYFTYNERKENAIHLPKSTSLKTGGMLTKIEQPVEHLSNLDIMDSFFEPAPAFEKGGIITVEHYLTYGNQKAMANEYIKEFGELKDRFEQFYMEAKKDNVASDLAKAVQESTKGTLSTLALLKYNFNNVSEYNMALFDAFVFSIQRKMVLQLEGHSVVIVPQPEQNEEPEIVSSFEQGGVIPESAGDSFRISAEFLIFNDLKKWVRFIGEPFLVCAEVGGKDVLEGIRFFHSWIEDDQFVYSYTNGEEMVLPKNLYYQTADVKKDDAEKYLRISKPDLKKYLLKNNLSIQFGISQYREGGLTSKVELVETNADENISEIDDKMISLPDAQTSFKRLKEILAIQGIQIMKTVEDEFKDGGVVVGKRHSESDENGTGEKFIVDSTGQLVELEGGEIVLAADAMSGDTVYEFEGKEMTGREIASELNHRYGGVKFDDGGKIDCGCNKYYYGGELPSATVDNLKGGEAVVNYKASQSDNKYEFAGKDMTPREILSQINADHGGKKF